MYENRDYEDDQGDGSDSLEECCAGNYGNFVMCLVHADAEDIPSYNTWAQMREQEIFNELMAVGLCPTQAWDEVF